MDSEKSLVDCFKKTINAKFRLESSGQDIIVKERQVNTLALTLKQTKHINCFGFMAETGEPKAEPEKPEPLALLVNKRGALSGVRQMCDGIIVFSQGKKNYIIAVELKGSDTKNAHKQIGNASILCEWLINLFKEHNHWDGDHKFCGIISKGARHSAKKGTLKHGPLKIEKHKKHLFIHSSYTKIHLSQIADSINQGA